MHYPKFITPTGSRSGLPNLLSEYEPTVETPLGSLRNKSPPRPLFRLHAHIAVAPISHFPFDFCNLVMDSSEYEEYAERYRDYVKSITFSVAMVSGFMHTVLQNRRRERKRRYGVHPINQLRDSQGIYHE
jgi:hypothetical protein